MLEFLMANWREIVVCICAVVSVLVTIFKSKSKVIIERSHLDALMQLVNEAEKRFKFGADKLQFVLTKFKEQYPIFYSQLEESSKLDGRKPEDLIIPLVEYILTTPQKKSR